MFYFNYNIKIKKNYDFITPVIVFFKYLIK